MNIHFITNFGIPTMAPDVEGSLIFNTLELFRSVVLSEKNFFERMQNCRVIFYFYCSSNAMNKTQIVGLFQVFELLFEVNDWIWNSTEECRWVTWHLLDPTIMNCTRSETKDVRSMLFIKIRVRFILTGKALGFFKRSR